MALGHYADGRASLVVGTHTHIPTADLRILPGGTAYQTDAGMCGDYDSVIGMEKQAAMDRFLGRGNNRLSVALGPVTLTGVIVETDNAGLATLFTLCAVVGFWRNLIAGATLRKPATNWLAKPS